MTENNYLLELERVFNAPRDLLWQAWTEPRHLSQWWGPAGYQVEVMSMDLRPGGLFHYRIQAPTGQDMWGIFEYRQVQKPDLLEYVNSFSNAERGLERHPMSAAWPLKVQNVMRFLPDGIRTRLKIGGGPFEASAEEIETFTSNVNNVKRGLEGTFGQLDAYLAKIQQG
jgi:uncharacterized protein YndB with AHSA1/START domain